MDGIYRTLVSGITNFSQLGAGLILRPYQREAAEAILYSIQNELGLHFVVQFPRQSGKNEVQAQLEAYLLAVLSEHPLEIVKVSPTWKPQAQVGMRRLERALQANLLTRGRWTKEAGHIYRLGKASLTFLSGSPGAHVVGATASLLLECDEAQEVLPAKWDRDFAPMAASANATCVFWGTAWTSTTLLARELRRAAEEQARDGQRRLFVLTADEVSEQVPAYARFIQAHVNRLGRDHPLVKTQFYGEEIDAEGSLFPPSRLAMMQGEHPPQHAPLPGGRYALLLDVAGQDEASPDPSLSLASDPELHNPARDATALTVVQVDGSTIADELIRAPTYRAVQRYLWTGVAHTDLYGRLKALAEHWNCACFVVDATGIGAGLASFLGRSLGLASQGGRLVPFTFTSQSKSKLAWDFLALIDSGRYKDYDPGLGAAAADDPARELQELFFRQAAHCRYHVIPGAAKRLRWGVEESQRDPITNKLLHDDLLLSAALCAELDGFEWPQGEAMSYVIPPHDIFTNMSW